MKHIIIVLNLLMCTMLFGQNQTKRVLFLGNSYTNVNDLPQMVADVTASTGDTLIFDSNTPGGYTFEGHSTNSASLGKIAAGNWDYVVLQEQSQMPSFPDSQVESDVFPYAHILDSIIVAENPCAETIFYMTWGRKNGDASNCASWPPVCTYEGMDSLLSLRYRTMADSNNAILSPVGAVWHYIRQNFPQIELYQSDESHPSVAGTYLAACCFYTAIFRKDPSQISFNSSLSAIDAKTIRNATKLIVYDSLINWNIGKYDPVAAFTYTITGNQVSFINNSVNANTYLWVFCDGSISSDINPVHLFGIPGTYCVALIAEKCGIEDTLMQYLYITQTGIVNTPNLQNIVWSIYPNPVTSDITLNFNQYLPAHLIYIIFNQTGKEILKGNINDSNKKIGISSLSDGIYFLQLFDGNKALGQQKFIKTGD